MDRWNQVRTAFAVARLGTVSAAAEELGIHRATVIRHIDALEADLGSRLFQRHARGYTPTEAGLDLERVARTTHEQLDQLVARTRGREAQVTGELIVTSVEIVSPLVSRALARVREAHPDITVRYVASGRILELAYGEAHLAVRVGSRPDHPDNVVRPFLSLRSTFYAHDRYVQRHGLPKSDAELAEHVFVSHEDPGRTAFFRWLESAVPSQNIILRSGSQRVLLESVRAGIGIGFLPMFEGATDPELHRVMPPREDWSVPLWLVTHVDLHRSAKVQAISKALLEVAEQARPSLE
ncbi:MAG: LysR family transcriptional regulator [Myxococcota bacterium]